MNRAGKLDFFQLFPDEIRMKIEAAQFFASRVGDGISEFVKTRNFNKVRTRFTFH